MNLSDLDDLTFPSSNQFVNITGRRFGRYVITGYAGARNQGKYWHAKCDCGNDRIVFGPNLKRGLSQSCGCLANQVRGDSIFRDLTGQKFGRLSVISFAGMKDSWASWNSVCDCGNEKIVLSGVLIQGQAKSCGCLRSEMAKDRNKALAKQGGEAASNTAEYRTWRAILSRCHSQSHPKYHLYGGRGIIVCDRWRNSYAAFLEDMGRRPAEKPTIDRFPNGEWNYEPENCRWATYSEQNYNRRKYTRRWRKKPEGWIDER